MSNFYSIYKKLNWPQLDKLINLTTENDIENVINKEHLTYEDFLYLLSPVAEKYLEQMAIKARELTQHHFGNVIQFYVPLYLSNICTSGCLYCGFSKDSSITRKTLSIQEIDDELNYLKNLGFQNILLLTGSAQNTVGEDYVVEAIKLARKKFAFVSLEIFAATQEQYEKFVDAGASGLTIYQETYHKPTYIEVHPQGPKKNFEWRINTPDRALSAGFRKIGLGALLGLYDWRYEASLLGLHAQYLMKNFWRSELSVSFPRMRDMGRNFKIKHIITDRHLVQMILAMRLFIPQTGLVLSTRESPELRDHLMGIGITQMSAGSKTNPGGYNMQTDSGEQFSIADHRSLGSLIEILKKRGFDPVLKDWAEELKGIERT